MHGGGGDTRDEGGGMRNEDFSPVCHAAHAAYLERKAAIRLLDYDWNLNDAMKWRVTSDGEQAMRLPPPDF